MSNMDLFSQLDDIDPEEMHRRAEELENIPNITIDDDGLIECPVLPLRDVIVYPHMVAPLPIGRRSTMLAIQEAQNNSQIMIAIPQRDPARFKLRVQDFLNTGVAVAVSEMFTASEEEAIILVQGRYRVEIQDFLTGGPVLYARGRVIEDVVETDEQQDALMRRLMRTYERFTSLNTEFPEEALRSAIRLNSDPSARKIRLAVIVANDDVANGIRKVAALGDATFAADIHIYTDIDKAEAWLSQPLDQYA